MSGISNINNPVQYNAGKAVRKLSFEIGEVFSARIVDEKTDNGEVVLKLNNGWKFSAKLTRDINYDNNIFNKFIVEGYEDGKLKIKLLPPDENKDTALNNIQENILKDYLNNKEDYNILKTLLDHSIPLTKENISNVKSIMKFKDSIIENPSKVEEFIEQYMKKNEIDKNSDRGQEVKKLLESFFKELRGFSTEEFATFIENGIEINEDNIISFNKVFKQDAAIYRRLENISVKINEHKLPGENSENIKQENSVEVSNKSMENGLNKEVISNSKTVELNLSNSLNRTIDKPAYNNLNKIVLDEINLKINDMKDTIKELINKVNLNKESFEKIVSAFGNNINDIKLFNMMSEGYYYLDVPVNFKNKDYNCKLIIKDDRKSGKKIDSKNVKLIASIKTINMGVIDTFIKVNNNNLNVDIKSEEKWIKLLEAAKDRLSNKITDMGYIVNLKVEPRESEVDIVRCRSFFNNEYSSNLDRRV